MKEKFFDKWFGIAIIAWLFPVVLFWIVLRVVPMLFFLIAYTWYPLLAGTISYVIASRTNWPIWKWSVPLIICVLNILVFYMTYAITNALGMSKVAWDNTYIFTLNAIGAGIGLGIGAGVLLHKRKNI